MQTEAIHHLRSCDPRFAEWIDRIGVIQMPKRAAREPYHALLESIAHQPLAGSAARAIWNRVLGLFEGEVPEAERLAALSEEHLRTSGLSRSKALSMKDIAVKTLEGHVPSTRQILGMSDEDIYERLTQIRGVGPWTVDMLMIFNLRRPDVLPVTDFGVRKGFKVLYRKRALPAPKLLLKTAERWRPYRTTAALYLWRIADSK